MKFAPDTVQCRYASPLGHMILAAHGARLAGLWFEGQRHQPDTADWPQDAANPVLQQTMTELSQYFAGQRQVFDLPLDLERGTAFQQAVWRALLAIPCGQHSSYAALAAAIGKPRAVRAVGGAVGRTPLSIVVPCHRVLGALGALTGYAGGLERKVKLLQLESRA